MVNVQVSRLFRNASARLTTSVVSGNCGPALSFPVGCILTLATQPRPESWIVCAGDVLRSALNRAVKILVLLEVDRKHAQRLTAAGADHVNALVWSIFISAIKTLQRTKDALATFPTWIFMELFATPSASHENRGFCLLCLSRTLTTAISNAKLLNAPAVYRYSLVAESAFRIYETWQASVTLDKHYPLAVTSRRQCSATSALALYRQIVHTSILP
jgi:hypothetical protein